MQTQMKMRNLWTILEILQQAQISLEITDIDGNTTLWEDADVLLYMRLYATFSYVTPSASNDTDAAFATDFMGAWSTYLEVRIPEISRAYHAMDSLYDPISNYDMHEHAADATAASQLDVETTPTGKTHTDSKTVGKESIKLGRQGADSSDYEPYDETITESDENDSPRTVKTETYYDAGTKSTTSTKYQNTQSATVDGQTVTGHEKTEHVLTRSGNIGVTTSQQMIQSEIDLRKNNLLRDVVKEFILMHCVLVG